PKLGVPLLQQSGNSCTPHLISMLISSAFLFSSHIPINPYMRRRHRPIPNHVSMLYMLSTLHASVMPQTKAMICIENVVATASIDQRVDLNLIAKNFVDVEYHPDRFP